MSTIEERVWDGIMSALYVKTLSLGQTNRRRGMSEEYAEAKRAADAQRRANPHDPDAALIQAKLGTIAADLAGLEVIEDAIRRGDLLTAQVRVQEWCDILHEQYITTSKRLPQEGAK